MHTASPIRLPFRPTALLLSACVAVFLMATPARGAEFRRWAESARGLAMGGAMTAVARGSDAMLYNPAGLSLSEYWKVEAAAWEEQSEGDPAGFFDRLDKEAGNDPAVVRDFLARHDDEPLSLRNQLFATFHTSGGFGVGALESHSLQTEPVAPATLGLRYERLRAGMATWSSASELRLFMMGLTLRGMSRRVGVRYIDETDVANPAFDAREATGTGNDFAYDLGVMMRLPVPFLRPTLGVAYLNGNDPDFNLQSVEPLHSELNVGLALQPDVFGPSVRLLLVGERRDLNKLAFPDEPSFDKRSHLGAEVSFFPLEDGLWGLQLRVGESQVHGTWGFGINLSHYLSVDYAHYTEELGTDADPEPQQRDLIQVRLGF